MEYRRPRMDESPDQAVVSLHERRIFPLLRNRRLFADVQHFHLFDFAGRGGKVNENVLAYSNRRGSERALVLYHNKRASARGWVRTAAPTLERSSGKPRQRVLADALNLPRTGFAIFRDHVTGREYIRDCAELWEKGLDADLSAYQHQVLLDWTIVRGADWEAVCRALKGASVASVRGMREGMSLGAAVGGNRHTTKRTKEPAGKRAREATPRKKLPAKKSSRRRTPRTRRLKRGVA